MRMNGTIKNNPIVQKKKNECIERLLKNIGTICKGTERKGTERNGTERNETEIA